MRVFSGISIEAGVRQRCGIVAQELARAAFEAHYEALDKLHITLAFLGNVQQSQLPDITAVVDDVAARTPAFELTLDRIGAFPNERRPRIIYIGSRAQSSAFHSLASDLREQCSGLGFQFRDDIAVHVTIGRVKGGCARPLPMLDVAPLKVRVQEIALFESLPDKNTTRYVVRHTASLNQTET